MYINTIIQIHNNLAKKKQRLTSLDLRGGAPPGGQAAPNQQRGKTTPSKQES